MSADVNTVTLRVERVMSDCGGVSVVVGCLRRDNDSTVTTHQDSVTVAVFSRDTVSRCHIEPGSIVVVHPPWYVTALISLIICGVGVSM